MAAGLHYTVLVPGEMPELPAGKVQLVELFMYISGISHPNALFLLANPGYAGMTA